MDRTELVALDFERHLVSAPVKLEHPHVDANVLASKTGFNDAFGYRVTHHHPSSTEVGEDPITFSR